MSSPPLWHRVASELDGHPLRVRVRRVERIGGRKRRKGGSGVGVAAKEEECRVREAVEGGLDEVEWEDRGEKGEGRGCGGERVGCENAEVGSVSLGTCCEVGVRSEGYREKKRGCEEGGC